jgi:hypothetical protein
LELIENQCYKQKEIKEIYRKQRKETIPVSEKQKNVAENEFQLRASSKAEPTNSPQYAIKGKKQRMQNDRRIVFLSLRCSGAPIDALINSRSPLEHSRTERLFVRTQSPFVT